VGETARASGQSGIERKLNQREPAGAIFCRLGPLARTYSPRRRFARSSFRLFRLRIAVEVEHHRLSHIWLDDFFDELDVERVFFENPQTLLRIEIDRDKKTPRIRFIRPSAAPNIGGYRDLQELDSGLHHDHFELSSTDIWLQFVENDVMEHELFRL
jgi:hypothetical protein